MGRIQIGLFLLLIYIVICRQMEGPFGSSEKYCSWSEVVDCGGQAYENCSRPEDNAATEEDVSDLTDMEALDKVKALYASNFDKVLMENSADSYYYKLEDADYYLVSEGLEEDGIHYLIHLYEFVLDEPDTGTGHTVTYGWYAVNKQTGRITLR